MRCITQVIRNGITTPIKLKVIQLLDIVLKSLSGCNFVGAPLLKLMLSAMSSRNHQPNLKKRQYSEVDPEFTSLPGLPLNDAKVFAQKSQEALLSVQKALPANTFPGNSFVFLPLISPHRLQQRFKVKENSVFIVARKAYTLLKDDVFSLNLEDYCGLYVR